MSKTTKLIGAYVLGQVTQLVIHGMCLSFNMYAFNQIPFCSAAGFIILFAVIAGAFIASRDTAEARHEKKTYFDWAKIPGEVDEVGEKQD